MGILKTLNKIHDRLVNNNFQYISDWANTTAVEIDDLESRLAAVEDSLDAHLNP